MLNLSKSGAEVKLWKYLIFMCWTKCRVKMQNQGYETLQPGKRKETDRVQRKVKPCDELPPNLRSQSNTVPENESSWNRYLLRICKYMTWSIISHLFQLDDLVTFFYIIRMLCSFSAGEGGDCSKNLWILRRFLCVWPLPLDNIEIFTMLVTTIIGQALKHLQISPIYCAVVALYLTQSLQKWRAENFFLALHFCHSLL